MQRLAVASLKRAQVTAIRPAEYANRRRALVTDLRAQDDRHAPLVLLRAAAPTFSAPDVPHIRRESADFRYLTGCNTEPSACLVVEDSDEAPRSTLFVHQRSPHELLWEGQERTNEELQSTGALDQILPLNELPAYLASALRAGVALAVSGEERRDAGDTVQALVDRFVGARLDLRAALARLRWIKSSAEIEHLRCAAHIGAGAFDGMLARARHERHESTLVGLLEYEMRRRGADSQICLHAYPPVIAAGSRACTIHYLAANQPIRDTDTVLVDAGADYQGYVSDITRCFPASGRFSAPQRELYEALVEIQEACLDFAASERPLTLSALYMHMLGAMAAILPTCSLFVRPLEGEQLQAACQRLCEHHVSHYLGADVHDTPTISRSIQLQPNVVITVEPGVYVTHNNPDVRPEFRGLGFRIEDDVLFTSTGIEVLSKGCVKQSGDIERMMRSADEE